MKKFIACNMRPHAIIHRLFTQKGLGVPVYLNTANVLE
jgi:hypothetical protein